MEQLKKVEIITPSLELDKVLEVLDNVGVSGYTIIRDITGKGERGRASNDLESNILSNGYVMTVCTEEQVNRLVEVIRPILKKFGGVCLVSDALGIIH